MTVGVSSTQDELYSSARKYCEGAVGERSIYRILAEQGHLLFPDEMFADLYSSRGRRSIAPRVMATVMVLQRFEGLSDREATERLQFDLRFKWACGLAYDAPSFHSTLLVDMRARLLASAAPDRVFHAVLDVAKSAKLVGTRRIVDSTALYDAVATQDTVTLVRCAIVGVLRVVGEALAKELRGLLKRDDTYEKAGKPTCAWDDKAAREELIDALTHDAHAILLALEGRELSAAESEAALLLGTVVGQDIEKGEDGRFRIARRVAPDRVISTVDPEARHGHKTESRHFDGYKGHVAIDADSEIITATTVTSGNAGDASVADVILADVIPAERSAPDAAESSEVAASNETAPARTDDSQPTGEVFGDASYGTASLVERLEAAGLTPNVKVQPPTGTKGMYWQDAFAIDTEHNSATCPAGVKVSLHVLNDGSRWANFGASCTDCPQRAQCTKSKSGRSINVHAKHDTLDRHRKLQRDDAWRRKYRATRPRVERKIAHLMKRKHGGRRARVRGCKRVKHDFAMLAAGINLARLAALGIRITATTTKS